MAWFAGLTTVMGKLFGPAAFNLLTPFIPGGVLVLGGIALRSDWRGVVSEFPKIFGDATSGVLVIFTVYVAGMLLIYVVNHCSEVLGYGLGYVLGAKLNSDPLGSIVAGAKGL